MTKYFGHRLGYKLTKRTELSRSVLCLLLSIWKICSVSKYTLESLLEARVVNQLYETRDAKHSQFYMYICIVLEVSRLSDRRV